jgi:hypothetical protein
MILDPINDAECLGQLTIMARELVPTTLIRMVAKRLGSRDAVIQWMQSLPQANDDGAEQVRYIVCDVPQRARLLPDDPNCVERSLGALMLLEALDAKTPRALATVDKPLRHTGLVEQHNGRWHAVDLFPRRNFEWGEFGKDVLQGVHTYVGKPVLTMYGMGSVADTLGEYEDKGIGRDKKKQPQKKDSPPPDKKQPEREQPKGKPPEQPKQKQPEQKPAEQSKSFDIGSVTSFLGAGAKSKPTPADRGGGTDAQEAKDNHPGAAPGDSSAVARPQAADRDGGDSHHEGEETPGGWWFLGR